MSPPVRCGNLFIYFSGCDGIQVTILPGLGGWIDFTNHNRALAPSDPTLFGVDWVTGHECGEMAASESSRTNESSRLQRALHALTAPMSGPTRVTYSSASPPRRACAALVNARAWFHTALILKRRRGRARNLCLPSPTRLKLGLEISTTSNNLPPRRFAAAALYFPLACTSRPTRCFTRRCASPNQIQTKSSTNTFPPFSLEFVPGVTAAVERAKQALYQRLM